MEMTITNKPWIPFSEISELPAEVWMEIHSPVQGTVSNCKKIKDHNLLDSVFCHNEYGETGVRRLSTFTHYRLMDVPSLLDADESTSEEENVGYDKNQVSYRNPWRPIWEFNRSHDTPDTYNLLVQLRTGGVIFADWHQYEQDFFCSDLGEHVQPAYFYDEQVIPFPLRMTTEEHQFRRDEGEDDE